MTLNHGTKDNNNSERFAMIVKDKERSISFLSEVTGNVAGIESVMNRIDSCEIPGMYDVEFVSVSLGDKSIKSVTVYLIESPSLNCVEKQRQRLDTLKFYGRQFNWTRIKDVFAPSGCPLRIDPSFKASDSKFVFRLDPQFRGRRSSLPSCLYNAAKYLFSNNARILDVIKEIATPGRFAVELDSANEVGRKIRLYYYDNYKYKSECIRGVTVNTRGEISREKHYLGVHGHIQDFRDEIEKITASFFAKQIQRQSIYQDYDMSLFFLAYERSDYGVDAKLYFRNEQIAPERSKLEGVEQ